MWNLFRKFLGRADTAEFPVPEWPPIQNLNSVDIIARRKDEGIDLVIVGSQPIDDSPETLKSIREKVRTYLTALGQEDFQAEFDHPPLEKTRIIIACEFAIHPRALEVIAECHARAAAQGVLLEVKKSPDSPPLPLPPSGNAMLESIRAATTAEEQRISSAGNIVMKMLQLQNAYAQLTDTTDDLRLLQRLQDEGALQPGNELELEAVGIVFGRILAAETPLKWITVEWEGERVLGLNYPHTSVIVFPDSMIAKRVDRSEPIDFESLFGTLVTEIERMKDDPEIKRK